MGNRNRMPHATPPRRQNPRKERQQQESVRYTIPRVMKVGVTLLSVLTFALLIAVFYMNSTFEGNLTELQSQITQLERNIDDKDEQIEEQEKQIEELEDESAAKDDQIKELEEQIANQAEQPDQTVAIDPELENTLYLDLKYGRVVIKMRPDLAPNHVERIKTLTREGFYDGIKFHRVIDGFMAQAGDPTGTGTSGSHLPDLKAEFSDTKHVRGTVSMARQGGNVDSANSQFFIVYETYPSLDGEYTVWGEVTEGMEFVDAIVRGEPPDNPDIIEKMQVAADAVQE